MDEGARRLAAETGRVASRMKRLYRGQTHRLLTGLFTALTSECGVLTRRPGHFAAAQHVHVQVEN